MGLGWNDVAANSVGRKLSLYPVSYEAHEEKIKEK